MLKSHTPVDSSATLNRIPEVFETLKTLSLNSERTTAPQRIAKLKTLKTTLWNRRVLLQEAISKDLHKSPLDVDLAELYPMTMELDCAIRNLKKWMKPKTVGSPLLLLTSRSQLYYEPKGVVLILGAWNYPVSLIINPLIAAIAAGNRVIVKPSELAPHSSQFLTSLIQDCFSQDEVAIFEGGPEVSQQLLKCPFDHILYTGGTRVGKIVMEAAAKHLTPVTLELGGKCPVIVDETTSLSDAAHRIVYGKFFSSGQTCIAPDYVLAHSSIYTALMDEIRKVMETFYGKTKEEQMQSSALCRSINSFHYERIKSLVHQSVKMGAKVEVGGEFNDDELFFSPTVLTHVNMSNPCMDDEIFGPVLPILTYKDETEIYSLIRSKPKPLALYIFSSNKKRIEKILQSTSSGGAVVNGALIHYLNHNLPFGGIGNSGMGSYHGHYGFKTFSHERAVLKQGFVDMVHTLYPPYGKKHEMIINVSMKLFTR